MGGVPGTWRSARGRQLASYPGMAVIDDRMNCGTGAVVVPLGAGTTPASVITAQSSQALATSWSSVPCNSAFPLGTEPLTSSPSSRFFDPMGPLELPIRRGVGRVDDAVGWWKPLRG